MSQNQSKNTSQEGNIASSDISMLESKSFNAAFQDTPDFDRSNSAMDVDQSSGADKFLDYQPSFDSSAPNTSGFAKPINTTNVHIATPNATLFDTVSSADATFDKSRTHKEKPNRRVAQSTPSNSKLDITPVETTLSREASKPRENNGNQASSSLGFVSISSVEPDIKIPGKALKGRKTLREFKSEQAGVDLNRPYSTPVPNKIVTKPTKLKGKPLKKDETTPVESLSTELEEPLTMGLQNQ